MKLISAQREIEISHWGNTAIEEVVELKHAGAKLKGGFSRFDYQHSTTLSETPVFRELHAKLPLSANNIYYRFIECHYCILIGP
jgi:oligosaccharyltransferase complex subunit alpha (ribophorin I)